MNIVKWVLQDNMRNQLSLRQMVDALEHIGIEFQTVFLRPFKPDIPQEAFPAQNEKIICWGPSFVPRAVNYPKLSPGIWYDDTQFRWSRFQDKWAEHMLSQDGKVMSMRRALENLTSDAVFMRPDTDSKAFNGGVYSRENPPQIHPDFGDIQIVQAPLRPVQDEWRFFIVDQDIIAASSYRVLGQPNIQGVVPDGALRLARRVIKIWGPAKVYCLDIGLSHDKFGIIEANCFNASRLYGANPVAVAKAVSAFVRDKD